MRRRRRRGRGLGSTVCRLRDEDLVVQANCHTQGKTTLCVGDRVTRKDIKVSWKGTVLAFQKSGYARTAKEKAAIWASVCQDNAEPGERTSSYQLSELKKVPR